MQKVFDNDFYGKTVRRILLFAPAFIINLAFQFTGSGRQASLGR
jgi:hypothetical protein